MCSGAMLRVLSERMVLYTSFSNCYDRGEHVLPHLIYVVDVRHSCTDTSRKNPTTGKTVGEKATYRREIAIENVT